MKWYFSLNLSIIACNTNITLWIYIFLNTILKSEIRKRTEEIGIIGNSIKEKKGKEKRICNISKF